MRSSHSKREIEIKLPVANIRATRRLLKDAGLRAVRRRVFEDNYVLDTPELMFRRTGVLLRVRSAGGARTLTYKGPAAVGKHKSREELEIGISDARAVSDIFERLGFRPVFRYQKFRTEYAQRKSRGAVMLDETPIGCYLEIEGAPGWIDRTARALGFSESDYITASYAGLYLQFCKEKGTPPGDMVFARST